MNFLFSHFNPQVDGLIYFEWIIMILPVYFLSSSNVYCSPSDLNLITGYLSSYMVSELKPLFMGPMDSYLIHSLVFVFTSILWFNLMGLLPFVSSPAGSWSFSVTLAFSLWLSSLMSMIFMNPIGFFSSLVPGGSPVGMSFFLVLVEFISSFIRPFTLSIRITVNLMAGHLLLSMASVSWLPITLDLGSLSFMLGTMALMMELMVAVIQSYVFVALSSIYWGNATEESRF